MTIDRINSFALQQTVINGSNKVLGDLVDLQQKLSSGYSASSYAELGGTQTQILSSLTNQMSRSKNYINNNSLIVSRLQNTNQAVSNILTTANSMLSELSQARNGALSNSIPFAQQMQDFQATLSGELNTNVENRFLFSGASTDTPPIKSTIPDPVTVGTPDSSYYQGSGQDLTTLVQDNQSLTYNVRADDPAFQKLFAGIAQAVKAYPSDQDGLTNAYNLIQQGLQGITAIQAQVNTNIVNVQDINSQQSSFQTYWQNATDNIDKTDIIAVSTQVSLDESTLTASYQTYSKIVGLRLSDYLH